MNLFLLSLPVVLAAVLLALPWEQELAYDLPRDPTVTAEPVTETDAYTRRDITFLSEGTACHAWLYVPNDGPRPAPVVVMAHGLGGQKDFGLHRYADRFAREGLAVLVFDYRTYGASDGEPRHWSSPARHIKDWEAAVKYIIEHNDEGLLDSTHIGLWGTSFAGGHVLVTGAAFGGNISAIVSQVPFLSGIQQAKANLLKRGVLRVLRLAAVGAHDKLRSLLGWSPAYITLVGKEGDATAMILDEAEMAKYYAKHPPKKVGGWMNLVRAGLVLELSRYNPIQYVKHIQAPVLFVSSLRDHLCPPGVVREAATKMGDQATLMEVEGSHFDVYLGETYEQVVAGQVVFLKQHLMETAQREATR